MTSRTRRLVAATASTALLALGVAACSAGDDDSGGGDNGGSADSAESVASASEDRPEAPAPAGSAADADQAALADSMSNDGFTATSQGGGGRAAPPPEEQAPELDPTAPRSLIKKGNVALRSTDVEDTLFEVRKVLQETGGEVAEDNTTADDEGEPERSLLTVRVPVEQFETALEGLKVLGTEQEGVDLIDSSSTTSDVSTQVIDVDVRTELQKRSIERISILLDRATSIRDIVNIERELARREADLGSLQKRQAFLADQTSLSTITISLERPKEKKATTQAKKKEKDETGFVAGLENGWDAFKSVTTGLLTGAGALLPFGVLALLVGVPLRVWLRRRQPSSPVGTTDASAPAGA